MEKRTYNKDVYRLYRDKRPRKIKYCQLDGCGRLLERFGLYRQNRYCSSVHAEEAKKEYQNNWKKNNRDKVIKYKRKYNAARKKKNDNLISRERNENPQTKTFVI